MIWNFQELLLMTCFVAWIWVNCKYVILRFNLQSIFKNFEHEIVMNLHYSWISTAFMKPVLLVTSCKDHLLVTFTFGLHWEVFVYRFHCTMIEEFDIHWTYIDPCFNVNMLIVIISRFHSIDDPNEHTIGLFKMNVQRFTQRIIHL